jgi:SAM-dependent methyltransferase
MLSGSLLCPRCNRAYPIRDGIAFLLPDGAVTESRYETPSLLSSYLWAHYGDLLGDGTYMPAYGEWAALMRSHPGICLDAGCAVGRFTFEMASRCDLAVGVDRSASFIRKARELMLRRKTEIALTLEGRITENRTIQLPQDRRNVEFIVGDAQNLPFHSGLCSSAASLNLVDKLPLPFRHLLEVDRVCSPTDAQFLISDPFSWSEEVAPVEMWLGGAPSGPFAGEGSENITALMTGAGGGLGGPPWRIVRRGHVWWKIRNTRNHFELIRSCYIKADR